MKILRNAIGLVTITSIAVLTACAGEAGSGDEATDDGALLKNGPYWSTKQAVPVCFERGSGSSSRRAVVKNIVRYWYEGFTDVEFSGWGDCAKVDYDKYEIRIGTSAGNSNSFTGMVHANKGESTTMNLNFNRSEGQLERDALHEFGHALGYAHEQDSPDNTNCNDNVNRKPNATAVTKYDPFSIMNYCSVDQMALLSEAAALSYNDILGLQKAYGVGPRGTPKRIVFASAASTYARGSKVKNHDISDEEYRVCTKIEDGYLCTLREQLWWATNATKDPTPSTNVKDADMDKLRCAKRNASAQQTDRVCIDKFSDLQLRWSSTSGTKCVKASQSAAGGPQYLCY